jgi:hypothetical protein
MSRRLTLIVAGLEFSIDSEPDLNLVEDNPLYLDFTPLADIDPDIHVSVEVSTAEPVAERDAPLIFDSGESWFAQRDGADLLVSFRSPTEEGRLWWRARLDETDSRVHVSYHPDLVKTSSAERFLSNPLQYPLDQLLTMLILANRNGCILHAAGIAHHGRGVAFVGRSGAGKTTLMRLLDDRQDLARLSDDRVVIRLVDGVPRIFGTPWAGEGLVAANLSADLHALVFLHKGDENSLRPIEPRHASHQLIPTTSIPWFDQKRLTGCLDTVGDLVRSVPSYDLLFRAEPAVGELILDLF